MGKAIATTAIISVMNCLMILMFSACTSIQSNENRILAQTNQQAPVFRGKIIPPRVDGESRYLLGCFLQDRKKHRLAIEEFKMAVQSNPVKAEAYNRLGVSLDAVGDYEQALLAYEAALEIDPNLHYVFNNVGYSYLLQNRPDLAIGCFEKAVALDVGNQRYRNNLGLAYAQAGKYDAALAAFKANGDDASAYEKLGQFFFREGSYEKADVYFAWASILKPSDADIQNARKASANLAQIHESNTVQPADKNVPSIKETSLQEARGDDGFYTIPAGAIEDVEIVAVHATKPSRINFSAANGEPDQPIYSVSATRIVSPAVDQATTQNDSQSNPVQPFDVLKRMEKLNLETIDTGKGSFTASEIEISNGNGVNGMARTVGNFLRTKGITNFRLTNADHFNHAKTVIYYKDGFFDAASEINGLLPGTSDADQIVPHHLTREPIRILIGRDLVAPFNDYREYNFSVDLSNGNGVNGMAKRLAKHLITKGFKVGRLTNADTFEYKQTAVFCSQGQFKNAKLVADALPGNSDSRIIELSNLSNRVQVVLGSDMVF